MSWFKYCLTQLFFYKAHKDTNTRNKYLECKDCPTYDNCTNELKDKVEPYERKE